jgi:hypothetical protein
MYELTGSYAPANSSPAYGWVEVVPDIVAVAGGVTIVQQPVRAALQDGSFTLSVIASDDPSWQLGDGQRMPYIIRETIDGLERGWMAYLDGTGGDIADLTPLAEAPDLGGGYLTQNQGDTRYVMEAERDQPQGFQGLDMQGRQASPVINSPQLTGVVGVPTAPLNTAGEIAASLDYVLNTVISYLQQHNLTAHRAFIRENAAVPNVPDTWTEVGYLNVPAHDQGSWFFTISMVWEFDITTRSAMFRISQDNGATWGDEFSIEPHDASDVYPFSYIVPRISQGNASTVRVQARKETGAAGVLNVRYTDLTFFRVA